MGGGATGQQLAQAAAALVAAAGREFLVLTQPALAALVLLGRQGEAATALSCLTLHLRALLIRLTSLELGAAARRRRGPMVAVGLAQTATGPEDFLAVGAALMQSAETAS